MERQECGANRNGNGSDSSSYGIENPSKCHPRRSLSIIPQGYRSLWGLCHWTVPISRRKTTCSTPNYAVQRAKSLGWFGRKHRRQCQRKRSRWRQCATQVVFFHKFLSQQCKILSCASKWNRSKLLQHLLLQESRSRKYRHFPHHPHRPRWIEHIDVSWYPSTQRPHDLRSQHGWKDGDQRRSSSQKCD